VVLHGSVYVRIPVEITIDLNFVEYTDFLEKNSKYIMHQSHQNIVHNDHLARVSGLISKPGNEKLLSYQKLKDQLNEKKTYTFTYFKIIATLEAGDTFGELALIYSRPRSATIEVASDVILISLEKEAYQRIIQDHEEKKVSEEIKFIKQFHIFSYLSRISLHKVFCNVKKRKFTRG